MTPQLLQCPFMSCILAFACAETCVVAGATCCLDAEFFSRNCPRQIVGSGHAMKDGLNAIDVGLASQKDWAPLVNAGGHNVQNRTFVCDSSPACIFYKESHGIALQ